SAVVKTNCHQFEELSKQLFLCFYNFIRLLHPNLTPLTFGPFGCSRCRIHYNAQKRRTPGENTWPEAQSWPAVPRTVNCVFTSPLYRRCWRCFVLDSWGNFIFYNSSCIRVLNRECSSSTGGAFCLCCSKRLAN